MDRIYLRDFTIIRWNWARGGGGIRPNYIVFHNKKKDRFNIEILFMINYVALLMIQPTGLTHPVENYRMCSVLCM